MPGFGQESPVITEAALEAMCRVQKPGVGRSVWRLLPYPVQAFVRRGLGRGGEGDTGKGTEPNWGAQACNPDTWEAETGRGPSYKVDARLSETLPQKEKDGEGWL